MAANILTQDYLHQIFDYKDGNLYWKSDMRANKRNGFIAGSDCESNRYIATQINGKKYKNHRLVFLYHHGYFPKMIDHIDNNTKNNKIENLREVCFVKNQYNAKIRKDNKSGCKGVIFNKASKKWYVQLTINKQKKHFGIYSDIDYAKFVAEAMRYKYHKEFARTK